VLEVGNAHIRAINDHGAAIVGHRPLAGDEIVVPREVRSYWGLGYASLRAERLLLRADEPLPGESGKSVRH
jgi:hypothetical protein